MQGLSSLNSPNRCAICIRKATGLALLEGYAHLTGHITRIKLCDYHKEEIGKGWKVVLRDWQEIKEEIKEESKNGPNQTPN
jgi:hypothetical protein